ncbi:PAS domain-containing protein [Rapidithrix thailandica]|uniref:histidine kinase n=1 Tax=Rapidithrix thailandica TaxID=413964 RepID=A0AAW9RZV6_9BACT
MNQSNLELERLKEVRKFLIQENQLKKELQQLVKLAAKICHVPMAAITRIDAHTQWFEVALGIEEKFIPRTQSFCNRVIEGNSMMIVEDVSQDDRFNTSPLFLSQQAVQFYAGVPLVTSTEHALGTLCVLGLQPQTLSDDQQCILKTLAKQVIFQLELKQKNDLLKQAQQALDEEKEWLRQAQALASIGNFLGDFENRSWKGSDTTLEILGFEEQRLYSWEEFVTGIDPEDLSKLTSQFQRLQTTQNEFHSQYRWYHRQNGKTLRIHTIYKVIKNAQNKPSKVFGVIKDVTHQWQTQKDLQESKTRLSALVNNLPGLVYTCLNDVHWTMLYISEGSTKLTGYEPDTFLKGTIAFSDLILPSYRNRLHKEVQESFHNNQSFELSYPIMVNGQVKWIWERGKAVGKTKDNVEILEGFMTDISEQIETEKALKLSEQRWQFALEGAGDGVWDWNLETGQVFFSKHWKYMLGYDVEEITDRVEEWANRVHPDDLARCYQDINRHISGEASMYVNEHRLRKKDGTYCWILDRGKVIEYSKNGKALRMIGTHTDITHRKRTERTLKRQNEEMLKANQELDNFVYRVSHDLRAPISSVIGIIELLKSEPNNSESASHLLELAKTSLKKQDTFIRDILDYSRNSRLEVNPEEINFQELMDEILSHFEFSEDFKEVHQKVHIEQNHPFHSDKKRLEIILNNLISNAFRYRNVLIQDSFIQIDVKVKQHIANIKIIDNGIGIQPQYLHKIFNMFYRATDKKPGSGLGLYIAKEAVNKIQGNIDVSSKPGVETKFVVTVPNLEP